MYEKSTFYLAVNTCPYYKGILCQTWRLCNGVEAPDFLGRDAVSLGVCRRFERTSFQGSTFKVKALCCIETSVNTNPPTRCHTPKDLNYRVSIKSFPVYKHLLQENYVEYKHIFFFQM